MRRLDANGNQKLATPRVFTQAQWPPSTPYIGEVVQLNDTNNSVSWMLEYRPDLNSAKPWRPYNGDTPASGYYDSVPSLGTNNAGVTNSASGTITIAVGGDWRFDLLVGGGSASSGVVRAFLGSTLGGSDVASTPNAGSNDALNGTDLNVAYTATKGQTIYVNITTTSSVYIGLVAVRFRPVNLENV